MYETFLELKRLTPNDGSSLYALVEQGRAMGESWVGSWTPEKLNEELGLISTGQAVGWGVRSQHLSAKVAFDGVLLVRAPGAAWEITLVAMAKDRRGLGGFKLMFSALLEFIRSDEEGRRGNLPVWLEVRADNFAAIAAYERAGFKMTGRRPNYYPDGAAALLYSFNNLES